ncbi:MAG TPA: tubulin/FtsZ family protein [Methanospirillum sp.]|jgi:cell division GTPase FtsZ|uniref:tubulin/FtsZ family protein n=1 Tax=Methanospirillum sp. TaxID=45200 RepID=UPI001BD354B3|nr:tubulin/FtsZ family protein [Methanospirillum sp.]HPY59236.1 tubulin/FtsZ family protein [Methanospirillum sp.]HQB99221.1 tubulin/FtsZ family protein [Methanospirillum sp.]
MRLLILGLGTAGSKIADAIIRPSRHSDRCSDLHAIAVDNDPEVLEKLVHIGEEAKFYFPKDDIESPELLTTRFTIDEVKAKLKGFDVGTHDAILVCAGLGGGLVSLVPHLVSIIRETMFEPVFALVTIPAEDEGETRLIRAMKNLQMIKPLVDGIIIFDNQLWLDKARGELTETILQKPPGLSEKIWLPGTVEKVNITPYDLVNRHIARRIRLLVHAGEIQKYTPQTVLDSREILNTITGMSFITIGLAEEDLPEYSRTSIIRHRSESRVGRHERAARIVKLAEKAAFRDISSYCDFSTARKALILLSGPEEELSMKGFMAVRKWIDESIDGFEMRAGDIPISSRQSARVSVLIIFSGLKTVTRVQELYERFGKKEREE